MTLAIAHIVFLMVVGPLVYFLIRLFPHSLGWKKGLPLLAVLLLGAGFFLSRPHEDILTGLDNMAYRKTAETFLEGRELVQKDPMAVLPPEYLVEAFLYRPRSPIHNPTRDVVFTLAPDGTTTRPWFIPTLPLAAAGSHLPGHFMSLLGALWFSILVLSCFSVASNRGLLIAVCFALATAWPAWFLRGYHAEGAANILATSVFLTAAAKPFKRPLSYAVAAFALGLSLSIHRTDLLVSIPVAFFLVLSTGEMREFRAILLGGLVGFLQLVIARISISRLAGEEWGGLALLKSLLSPSSWWYDLRLGVPGLLLIAIAFLLFSPARRERLTCDFIDRKLGALGWACLVVVPPLLAIALPFSVCKTIRAGLDICWSGIGLPCALLWSFAGLAIVWEVRSNDAQRRASFGKRVLLVLLCWASITFLYGRGAETPAGIWTNRRFLPIALSLTSLFAFSMASRPEAFARPWTRFTLLALLVCAPLFNLIRGADAYFLVNEKGTRAWRSELARTLEETGLTVFDYHPHSVPFASDPGNRVLGLGRHGHGKWPAIESWLSSIAGTGAVTIATSWTPSEVLESNSSLKPFRSHGIATNLFSVRYPVLASKGFFPVERRTKTATVALYSLVPNARLDRLSQDKFLDGSPIGLRGPWGKMRNATTWTRQGSAIVGPVTNRGTIVVTLDANWPEHPSVKAQPMTLTPPWGEEGAVTFQVATLKKGEQPSPIVLEFPAPTNATERTGLYRFTSPTPYDPAADGIRGYDSDLGIVLRRIRIETRDE